MVLKSICQEMTENNLGMAHRRKLARFFRSFKCRSGRLSATHTVILAVYYLFMRYCRQRLRFMDVSYSLSYPHW